MDKFDRTSKKALGFLENEYVSTTLSLFLILYAGLAAPQLPVSIARLFDNFLFKLLIFFLIAYMANKNPTIALISAIGLLISLQTLNKYQISDRVQNEIAAGMTQHSMEENSMEEQETTMEAHLPEETNMVSRPNVKTGLQKARPQELVPRGPKISSGPKVPSGISGISGPSGSSGISGTGKTSDSMELDQDNIYDLDGQDSIEGLDVDIVAKKYRSSASHQYVNMKPDEYKDRDITQSIGAFESGPNFATV